MFAPINPENERIRAQSILRSFTEQNEAVELFTAPRSQSEQPCEPVETVKLAAKSNRKSGGSVLRVFKAIKLNRPAVSDEPGQQPAFSHR